MDIITDPKQLQALALIWRAKGRSIGLVPTMGFFHAGHTALMDAAREQADRVVVSLFVNPTQFGPGEDFTRYPRDTRRDLKLLRGEAADLCFLPEVAHIYPEGHRTEVRVTGIEDQWEGATRPGHFAGVALVVTAVSRFTMRTAGSRSSSTASASPHG